VELSLYCSIFFEVRGKRGSGERKFLKIISRVCRKTTFSSLGGSEMGVKVGSEGDFGEKENVIEVTLCVLVGEEKGAMRDDTRSLGGAEEKKRLKSVGDVK